MNRVLITCSLSSQARGVITTAVVLAQRFNAEIFFCHVGVDEPAIRNQIQLILNDAGVIHPRLMIRKGQPDKVIRRMAKDLKVDLIIAGALEHERSLVGILGSVARRLVRKSTCSVLLLSSSKLDHSFNKILAHIQYDTISRQMIRFALGMAEKYHSSIDILHAYDFSLRLLGMEETGDDKKIQEYERECDVLEEHKLKSFLEDFQWKNIHLRCHCLKGKEFNELSHYANRVSADIIFMPLKNRMHFWQRLFNPLAEIVLQDMPCSIFFYRDQSL